MSVIQTLYPSAADTVALTITLSSPLVSDSNLLAGRQSTVVDNTTTLDLDHVVSGHIKTGASTPTVDKVIEVWAFASFKRVSSTASYPDGFGGSDANRSVTSRNVLFTSMRLLEAIIVDAAASRTYWIAPSSIAKLFDDRMPAWWGLWVVHNIGQDLSSTGADHLFHYERHKLSVV